MIKTRLAALMGEWGANHGKHLSFAELARRTGVNERTLRNWAHNRATRFDGHVLSALCRFFSCKVGDILVYVEE